MNEFKLIHSLTHRNIVRAKDIYMCKLKGKIYLLMEYVDGVELWDEFDTEDPKPMDEELV